MKDSTRTAIRLADSAGAAVSLLIAVFFSLGSFYAIFDGNELFWWQRLLIPAVAVGAWGSLVLHMRALMNRSGH